MNRFRRRVLAAATATVGAAALAPAAYAQTYPDRPIRLIVPFAAGSASDIVARTISEPMSRALGQPFIIDDKPGANSTLGTTLAAKSAPDGYTLVLATNSGLAASPGGLTEGLAYNPVTDLKYISLVGSIAYVLLVNNALDVGSAKELIERAKASPGKLNYASGNTGGIAYMGYIAKAYGVDMVHVPYKSTPPALVDLIGGQVQAMMADVASATPRIREGKVKALGVPQKTRHPLLPDVPTFAEQGLQTPPDMSGWWALVAPAGTPDAILERLNAEVVKVLNMPEVRKTLLNNGVVPTPSTRAEVTAYQREQLGVWTEIVRSLNLKQN